MPKSVLRAVLGRTQFTLRVTRRTPHGASRLVRATCAWLVKTRRAPSRHSRDARVYGHTTTAMHKLSTPMAALVEGKHFSNLLAVRCFFKGRICLKLCDFRRFQYCSYYIFLPNQLRPSRKSFPCVANTLQIHSSPQFSVFVVAVQRPNQYLWNRITLNDNAIMLS